MAGRFDPNDYVDCQERINRFWQENPNGAIYTEVLSSPDEFDRVVIRALVFKERPTDSRQTAMPDASGIAAEMKGGGGANSTSWHENGETSAIGRALANLGYATSRKDRPSRQEMQKAERHASTDLPPRTRTTSENTIPPSDDTPFSLTWSDFWKKVRAEGLPNKAAVEEAIGSIENDTPSSAMERVAAWQFEMKRLEAVKA